MVDIKESLTEEEIAVIDEIYGRVCEDLRELIEDYLRAAQEEVDTAGLIKDIILRYTDLNISVSLPIEREKELVDKLSNKKDDDMPTDMYI
jgi:hypothetical protein